MAPRPCVRPPSPMPDYTVQLDAYHGPLDLLLHLVKRNEVDLLDIPIAKLTDQYLDHVRLLKEIDVERAGDFLVMAATLLEIKSRMLSPRMLGEGESDAGEADSDAATEAGDAADPRFELVQQLLAYKRFKDAAVALEDRHHDWAGRAPVSVKPGRPTPAAGPVGDDEDDAALGAAPVEFEADDLHVMDLCQAFGRMLDSIGAPRTHDVAYDDTPIALHAADVEDRLARDAGPGGRMTLRQVFEGRSSRSEMIGLFLAVLELVRQRKVAVEPPPPGEDTGEVTLRLIPEAERDPDTEDAAAVDTEPQSDAEAEPEAEADTSSASSDNDDPPPAEGDGAESRPDS